METVVDGNMRVLYLTYYYLPHVGGGTWSTYHLSRVLSEKGHVVRVIAPNVRYALSIDKRDFVEIQKKNVSLVYRTPCLKLPRRLAPLLSMPFLLIKGLLVGKDSDIIVCQFHPHHFVLLIGLLLAKVRGKRVIARACDVRREIHSAHSGLFEGITRPIIWCVNLFNEILAKYADVFLVVCREDKEILESRFGQLTNVSVNDNGVDPCEFNGISKEESRRILNIESGSKVILFVGRFSGGEYRTDVLLRAFSLIEETVADVTLLLVGDSLPKGWEVDLPQRSARIRVVGPTGRSDIRHYLAAADVCVGPLGDTRTIPLKVLEYMACGKPVVTGIHSVSERVAMNGFNCMCVRPDPKAVSEAILEILQDQDLARRLGSNAERTAGRFTWDRIGEAFEAILLDNVVRPVSDSDRKG
jgi:glycosyltransferase involved in cell wall biosynthesis